VAEWFNREGRVAQVATIAVFMGVLVLTLIEMGQ
jgi:hypothetical protein